MEIGIGRLFESTTDAVILVDDRGRILLWNPSAEMIFGYTEVEALGMNVDRLVPPEMADEHHRGIERFAATGHGALIDAGKPIEVPAIRKDGTSFWIDLTLSHVEHEGRRYALAIVRDVTDRVEVRRRKEVDAKRLEDANESLQAFARVVGHDLKEPVRAMQAYLADLRDAHSQAERDELIERASHAQASLARLLDGLLEWSRAATSPLDLHPVRLRDVIMSPGCSAQWDNLVRERGAIIQIENDIPEVLATEDLLCRVFGNLITNAIRHNPAPTPIVRISSAMQGPDQVRIVVEDNGPGFPPDLIRRYARTLEVRSIRSGFGLAIARRAVERLNGDLHIENGPEGGAVVRIVLPSSAANAPRPSTLHERVRELV